MANNRPDPKFVAQFNAVRRAAAQNPAISAPDNYVSVVSNAGSPVYDASDVDRLAMLRGRNSSRITDLTDLSKRFLPDQPGAQPMQAAAPQLEPKTMADLNAATSAVRARQDMFGPTPSKSRLSKSQLMKNAAAYNARKQAEQQARTDRKVFGQQVRAYKDMARLGYNDPVSDHSVFDPQSMIQVEQNRAENALRAQAMANMMTIRDKELSQQDRLIDQQANQMAQADALARFNIESQKLLGMDRNSIDRSRAATEARNIEGMLGLQGKRLQLDSTALNKADELERFKTTIQQGLEADRIKTELERINAGVKQSSDLIGLEDRRLLQQGKVAEMADSLARYQADLGRSVETDRILAELEKVYSQDRFQNRQLDLQDKFQNRSLDSSERQFNTSVDLARAEAAMRGKQFDDTLAFQGKQLDATTADAVRQDQLARFQAGVQQAIESARIGQQREAASLADSLGRFQIEAQSKSDVDRNSVERARIRAEMRGQDKALEAAAQQWNFAKTQYGDARGDMKKRDMLAAIPMPLVPEVVSGTMSPELAIEEGLVQALRLKSGGDEDIILDELKRRGYSDDKLDQMFFRVADYPLAEFYRVFPPDKPRSKNKGFPRLNPMYWMLPNVPLPDPAYLPPGMPQQ